MTGVGFVGRNLVHLLVSDNLCSKVTKLLCFNLLCSAGCAVFIGFVFWCYFADYKESFMVKKLFGFCIALHATNMLYVHLSHLLHTLGWLSG